MPCGILYSEKKIQRGTWSSLSQVILLLFPFFYWIPAGHLSLFCPAGIFCTIFLKYYVIMYYFIHLFPLFASFKYYTASLYVLSKLSLFFFYSYAIYSCKARKIISPLSFLISSFFLKRNILSSLVAKVFLFLPCSFRHTSRPFLCLIRCEILFCH